MSCIHLIIYWLYYMPALLYADFIIYRLFASMAPNALKGQKLLAQGIALGNYGHKPVAL